MSRSMVLFVVVSLAVPGATLAAGQDIVSGYAWLHVAGETAGPSAAAPEDLEIDEEARKRFLEAEHPFVDLLQHHSLQLSRDGNITTKTVVARHFLSAEGVRNHGDLSVTVRAGERLFYDATIENTGGSPMPAIVWIDVFKPNGTPWHGNPILYPPGPMATLNRQLFDLCRM